MKVVLSVCTFAASLFLATGAPTFNDVFLPEPLMYNGPHPYLRARRSSYGPAYAAPCASSLPLGPSGGYYGPVHASYGGGYGGALSGGALSGGALSAGAHGGAYAAPAYGYAPHYRAEDGENTEILNFSDMDQGMSEHQPMARYGYGGAVGVGAHGSSLAGLGYGGQLAPAVASGPAFGVFPNANVGGCNVPLLLSCSPSIVPGRLVKSGYGAAGYGSSAVSGAAYGGSAALVAPNAYRSTEEQTHHEHEEKAEETSHSLDHSESTTHTDQ